MKLVENDIPLQISCPVMKQNKEGLSDVFKLSAHHTVHGIAAGTADAEHLDLGVVYG